MQTMFEVCAAVDASRPVAVPEGFARTLREAASKARSNRQIGLIQQWRINAASRNPRQLQRIYAGVIDEAIAAGQVDAGVPVDGFDWQQLLAFIERLLPLILQLISLFG